MSFKTNENPLCGFHSKSQSKLEATFFFKGHIKQSSNTVTDIPMPQISFAKKWTRWQLCYLTIDRVQSNERKQHQQDMS